MIAAVSYPIIEDLKANVDVSKHGRIAFWVWVVGKAIIQPQIQVVLLFRLSTVLYRVAPLRPFAFLLRSIGVMLGSAELHPGAKIAPGFCLVHSIGVLIGKDVVIGRNARIAHIVSIGEQGRGGTRDGVPTLGDNVTVGIGSVVVGPITVGDDAVIAANSFVSRDVPAGAIVGGSPARILKWVEGYGPATGQ